LPEREEADKRTQRFCVVAGTMLRRLRGPAAGRWGESISICWKPQNPDLITTYATVRRTHRRRRRTNISVRFEHVLECPGDVKEPCMFFYSPQGAGPGRGFAPRPRAKGPSSSTCAATIKKLDMISPISAVTQAQ
jgi:hypothetical protein